VIKVNMPAVWLMQRTMVWLEVRNAVEDGSVRQYLGHDEGLQRIKYV